MSDDLTIRRRRREDDERGLEIFHQHEQVFTMTLEAWRFHMDERVRPEGMEPVMRVAERDGQIIGDWYMEQHPWTTDPNAFFATVEVDKNLEGQGIGRRLWDDLEPVLKARGARKVYARATQGDERGQRFASDRGFRKTERADRISRLTVADANLEGYEGVEQRLQAENIIIKTMAELDQDNDSFMRELHAAIQDSVQDIPSTEEFRPTPYDVWRQNFLKSPGTSAETYWVALHEGHPIGLANLSLPASDRAFNGLTGTMRAFRGKGVARALKLKTIEWSRQNGIEYIDTGNDAENERMLAINLRLGYESLPARHEWLKEYWESQTA